MYIVAAGFVLGILCGEKNLRGIDAVFGENFVVYVHQLALADGGGSLLHAQLLRPLRQTHFGSADSDGAG